MPVQRVTVDELRRNINLDSGTEGAFLTQRKQTGEGLRGGAGATV